MAEDFQAGICGGSWWNLSRSALAGGSSPCLTGYADIGAYGWSTTDPNSVSDNFLNFPGVQKGGSGSLLMDSESLMMGYDPSSSPTSDWNQTVLSRGNGRTQNNLNSLFQHDEAIGINDHRSSRIRKDGSPENFPTIIEEDNSTDHNFKSVDQDFYSDQRRLSYDVFSGDSRNFSAGFPVDSTSYGYPSPLLLQTLLNPQNQQSSSLTINRSINSSSSNNFGLNCEDSSSSWPKVPSSYQKPSIRQQKNGGIHFSNNTPFWNSSSSDIREDFCPSSQPKFIASSFAEKPKSHNLTTKKLQLFNGEDARAGSGAKRLNGGRTDSVFKRTRIETPSPFPTFKVRKEKLGDRITALQQLVSPFGKTDTASVLNEAIEYIKFLHDQVGVLSTPYMKSGASIHHQEELEEAKKELRSRGLCLVPISSTFAVANETTHELWTPAFGATFK